MLSSCTGTKTFSKTRTSRWLDTLPHCAFLLAMAVLTGAERFLPKNVDMESRSGNTLDNYQNFAKAYKVRDFQPMMANKKAKTARLKGAVEFGKNEMGEGSQFSDSVLRAVLYAQMELALNVEPTDVVS